MGGVARGSTRPSTTGKRGDVVMSEVVICKHITQADIMRRFSNLNLEEFIKVCDLLGYKVGELDSVVHALGFRRKHPVRIEE